jgi:hypothetical protein
MEKRNINSGQLVGLKKPLVFEMWGVENVR